MILIVSLAFGFVILGLALSLRGLFIDSHSPLKAAFYSVAFVINLTTSQWLQHAQEEALDLAIYLERIKKELSK